MSFDQALLGLQRALPISLKADGDLVLQDVGSIPVSNVTWTTLGAVNGVGINGVLSKTTYGPCSRATLVPLSIRVRSSFSGGSPRRAPERAGPHQVTLRWRIESVIP